MLARQLTRPFCGSLKTFQATRGLDCDCDSRAYLAPSKVSLVKLRNCGRRPGTSGSRPCGLRPDQCPTGHSVSRQDDESAEEQTAHSQFPELNRPTSRTFTGSSREHNCKLLAPHAAADLGYEAEQTQHPCKSHLHLALLAADSAAEVAELLEASAGSLKGADGAAALSRLCKLSDRRKPGDSAAVERALVAVRSALAQEAMEGPPGGVLEASTMAIVLHSLAKLDRGNPDTHLILAKQVEDRASDFTPQGLATTMSSYAAIWATSAPPPGVFAALADQARHKMHQFTPQGIAMTARACAAVGYAEEGLLTVLGREACERVELFTPQGLAMMIRAWAVLQQPCGDLVEAISRASSRQAHKFNPQDIANTVWAFSLLGYRDSELLRAMSDRAGAQAELFKPQELAAFVSGLCALGSPAPGVLERCGRAIVRKSRSFKAQEVAMVVRAYAQAGVCDREVFEALARQAIHRRQEFDDPAMVSEVLRSYAEAQHPAPVLFDVLGQRVLEHLPFRRSLQLNAVASLLWAHLLSRHRSPHLVEALAEEAARRASELEPWELGMVARASSALHAATKVVLAALEERAIDIAGELSPRDMANIVWAFAYSGPSQHKSPVFEVLSHRIVHGSRAFRPKDTAAVLWAYSQASHPAPQLFEALATQAVAQSHHYSPRALSATMKALARMGYLSPKAFEVLGKRAAAAANEFDAVSVSNSLWALAAVKHRPDEVEAALLKRAEDVCDDMPAAAVARLAWVLAETGLECPRLLRQLQARALRCTHAREAELVLMLQSFVQLGAATPLLSDALARQISLRQSMASPAEIYAAVESYSLEDTSPSQAER